MNFLTKLRLNLKEYAKQIISIVLVFLLLVLIGKMISNLFINDIIFSKPIDIKNNKKMVLDANDSPSSKTHNLTNKVIKEFMIACNNFDFEKAYTYISSSNKEYFGNYKRFEHYLKKVFNEQKRYELRAYSKVKDIDIYQLRLFSDFLATGLTKQKFNYLDLKIAVKLDKDEPNGLMLNLQGFIKDEDLKYMFENDDLRVDFTKTTILYKSQIIECEIRNKKSEYLILKDFNSKVGEIATIVGGEERPDLRREKIILKPFETKKIYIEFMKFADDNKEIKSINFNDIRFIENYTDQTKDTDYKKRYTLDIPIRKK